MEYIKDLPEPYQELAKLYAVTDNPDLSGAFPWANTPEGYDFWSLVYTAQSTSELPDIPNIQYDSFQKSLLAFVTINTRQVTSEDIGPISGCAYVWETTEGVYTYYVEPTGEGPIMEYYNKYFKPVVTIQHIIKRLDDE